MYTVPAKKKKKNVGVSASRALVFYFMPIQMMVKRDLGNILGWEETT